MLVKNISADGQDSVITIRGSRNGTTAHKQAQLRFENSDNNPSPTIVRTLGSICGVVDDKDPNTGGLKFYTFSNGVDENVCMEMKSTGDIICGNNLTVTGSCTAGSYSGLPVANTSTSGVVTVGGASSGLTISSGVLSANSTNNITNNSTALITSGGIYTALASVSVTPTRQLVGTFSKSTSVDTDLTGTVPYIVWNNTIDNNNGITHNGGSVQPNNSLFNVIETGLYVFSIFIPVENKNASGRSYVACDLQVYTGSSLTSRSSAVAYMTYPISSVYVRGNDGATNTSEICGTLTVRLQAGKQFEFKGRAIYQTNTNCRIACQTGTVCKIERISSNVSF